MRLRRLLMIVHGTYPLAEPRVSQQAHAALAAGFAVEVIAMRGSGEAAEEDVDGVRVHRLPITHRRSRGALGFAGEYGGFAALAAAKAASLGRVDVVHVHAPPDFLPLAAIPPRLRGARTILDIHDFSADLFASRFGAARPLAIALRTIERIATSAVDAVLTVHEPYKRALVARGVRPDKIVVVMNSVDERIVPVRVESTDGFRVVYHGTLTPHYGVGVLVEAVGSLAGTIPGLALEILGDGDALDSLREQARAFDVPIDFSGMYLPRRDALERVASASVGVIPNLPVPLNRYALSTKLFEYAAIGVPVVAARLPTLEEHFAEDEVRFFEPGSPVDLARALADLARDPVAAREQAARAASRAEEYAWTESAGRYVRLLDELTRRTS